MRPSIALVAFLSSLGPPCLSCGTRSIPPLVPPLSFARACDSARGGHLQRAELPRALVASRWFEFGVRWQLLTPL